MQQFVYHVVTLRDLITQIRDNCYQPSNFDDYGFIHCTADKSSTLLVLEDYFRELSRNDVILILRIDVGKLQSEIRFEAPVPVQGVGTSHIVDGVLFPHIYGRLNVDAIVCVGRVERAGGNFVWPSSFNSLDSYL